MYQNYNTMETALALQLDFTIPSDHEARLISRFVDSIPSEFLLEETSHTGRPAFHPAMLLKMCLFAYSRTTFSGRKMERMNEESIPMKWLTGDTSVSYKTINNFRSSEHASKLIKYAFILFTTLLSDNGLIHEDALYIDGTKIQADANIYSFTWKKAIERYEAKLNDNVSKLYDELVQAKVNLALSEETLKTAEGIKEIIGSLDKELVAVEAAITEEKVVPKGGSEQKRRRRILKKYRNKCKKDFLPRKQRYEEANATFEDRNSFSKTDTDATFMCMKEDPMKNRELKPGYNLQVASSNQFVIAYDIFSNPTDTRTFIPFLESIQTLDLFTYIAADAGYGSEENYEAVLDTFGKVPLIPYGMYHKENTKAYRSNPKHRYNWDYDEIEDAYTDLDGVRFSFSHYSTRNDKNGFQRQFKVYKADVEQQDESRNQLAKTPKGAQRQTAVNYNWEYFKQHVKESLESDRGKEIYAQRKIDVETVFGRMKGVFGMRRTHVRGKQAVHNDIGIMLMSMNLTKLALEARRKAEAFYKNPVKNKNRNETIRIMIISLRFFYLRLVISQSLLLYIVKTSQLTSFFKTLSNKGYHSGRILAII
ncbi:IS1182 family transposase [Jeotgalibaca sp. PTS2502]|uniref:IS1182 family transposase n=1 Tax=Jeotgalibaca sp. PTS2502 TaxID=1903686 RepID=UPI000973990D|nr:IS1182 family transposase [Jeotgalibaca sp. PTS2502]APZ48269.1 IS1182 family transposase [Jeotgalibaca sp. PTS2502]